jgi:predicted aspartyl protease
MAQLVLSPSRDELQQEGPCVVVAIGAPRFEIDEGRSVGLEYPEPYRVKALIDTGAAVTVVNPQLVKTCKLRHTGFAEIVSAGGSGRYQELAAAIYFPDTDLAGIDLIRVVACPIVRQPVSCLIGKDILRRWCFLYDGTTGQIRIQE